MRLRRSVRIAGVGLLVAAATPFLAGPSWAEASGNDRRPAVSDTTLTAERVEAAFDAARSGDFGPSSALAEFGEAVVPLLGPYVADRDEEVRRQAVALLAAIDGEAAIAQLALALSDVSADIARRASVALYENYAPDRLAARPELAAALRESLKQGNESGAAILLLGYFPGAETEAALRGLRDRRGDGLTEVFVWTPVVPVALAVDVALSRLGDQVARDSVMRRIDEGEFDTLAFLLHALREIDAPPLLHALKDATLDDTREVVAVDRPSGVEPPLRLQDLAVTRFVERLGLAVGFEVSGARRYSDEEIAAVREAIEARVPM